MPRYTVPIDLENANHTSPSQTISTLHQSNYTQVTRAYDVNTNSPYYYNFYTDPFNVSCGLTGITLGSGGSERYDIICSAGISFDSCIYTDDDNYIFDYDSSAIITDDESFSSEEGKYFHFASNVSSDSSVFRIYFDPFAAIIPNSSTGGTKLKDFLRTEWYEKQLGNAILVLTDASLAFYNICPTISSNIAVFPTAEEKLYFKSRTHNSSWSDIVQTYHTGTANNMYYDVDCGFLNEELMGTDRFYSGGEFTDYGKDLIYSDSDEGSVNLYGDQQEGTYMAAGQTKDSMSQEFIFVSRNGIFPGDNIYICTCATVVLVFISSYSGSSATVPSFLDSGLFYNRFVAWEVWGPIIRVYIPTSTSAIEMNSHLALGTSGSNLKYYFPYIPFGVNGAYIKYLNIINYKLVSSSTPLILGQVAVNASPSHFATVSDTPVKITSESKNVLQKVNVQVKCEITSSISDTATLYLDNDLYTSSLNKTIPIERYNAYNIYVYDENSYTIDSGAATAAATQTRYETEYNNGTLRTVNPIQLQAGTGTFKLYLREVVVEKVNIDNTNSLVFDVNTSQSAQDYIIQEPDSSDIGSFSSVVLETYDLSSPSLISAESIFSNSDIARNFSVNNADFHLYELEFTYSNQAINSSTSVELVNDGATIDNGNLILDFQFTGVPVTDYQGFYYGNTGTWVSINPDPSVYTVESSTGSGYIHIKTEKDPSTATATSATMTYIGTAIPSPNTINTNIGAENEVRFVRYGSVSITYNCNNITKTYTFNIVPLSITSITIKDPSNNTVTSTDLWLIPSADHNDNTWNAAGKELRFVFDPSISGNTFHFHNDSINFTTNNIFKFSELPYNHGIPDWSDDGSPAGEHNYPLSADDITYNFAVYNEHYVNPQGNMEYDCDYNNSSVPTSVLYPVPGAYERTGVQSSYDVSVYSGSSFATATATASLTINIKRATSNIDASTSSNIYSAGSPISVNITKDGDEDWSNMNITLTPEDPWPSPTSDYTPTIVSYPQGTGTTGTLVLEFPVNMPSTLNAEFTIYASNHYGVELSTSIVQFTVNPVTITGVTGVYCTSTGGMIQSTTSSFDLGTIWYDENRTLYFYGIVDPSTALNTDVDISLENANNTSISGNTTKPSFYTGGSVNNSIFNVVLSGKRTGSGDTYIKLAAAGAPSIYSEFSVCGVMYTNTFTFKTSTGSNTTSSYCTVAPSGRVVLRVNFNGNETSSISSSQARLYDTAYRNVSVSCSNDAVNAYINSAKSDYFEMYVDATSVNTSATTTVTVSFTNGAGNVISKNITIYKEADATGYEITIDTSNACVYGTSDVCALEITGGADVTSFDISVNNSNDGYISTSETGPWTSTSMTAVSLNSSHTKTLYFQAKRTGVTAEIDVTARQYDEGASNPQADTDSLSITLGSITYDVSVNVSGRTTNETLYAGDSITFSATFSPAVSSTIGNAQKSAVWTTMSNINSPTYSYNSSTGKFTATGTAKTAGTSINAVFSYSSRIFLGNTHSGGEIHSFTISSANVWSRSDDNINVGTVTLNSLDDQLTSLDTPADITKGTRVDRITDASLLGLTAEARAANLTVGISGGTSSSPKLTASSTDAPSANTSFTIKLTGKNKLGDTIVNESAGTLQWRQGATGQEFSANYDSISVDGSIGETATYNITCSYKNASQQTINATWEYDSTYGIHYSSGSGWCNDPSTNSSSISISTKTKNYTNSPRSATFRLRTKYNNTSADYDYLPLTIVQNPMVVELTFDLSTSTSGATIDNTSHTASYKFVTRNESNIIFDVLCGYREKRYGTTGTNGTYYDSALNTVSWEHAETSASWFSVSVPNDKLQISANANNSIPGSNRSGTVTLSVQDFGGTGRSLSYTINISQDTFVYSNPSLVISPNPLTLSVLASTASLLVTCTYDASANGQSHQCTHSNWTYSTDINWNDFNISKNAETNNINISCPQNNTNAERTGTITVNSNFNSALGLAAQTVTVPVTQEFSTIAFTKANESADYNSHTLTNSISSIGLSWQLTEIHTSDNNNWLSISESSGTSTENLPNGVKEVSVGVSENLVNLAVYSKYRTNTNARTGYIKINDVGTNPVHYSTFNVSQEGYNFTQSASCTISKSKESYEPYDTAGSFTITANYDFDIEKGTGASWCIVNIVNEDKFANTDNASVSKSITINFNLLYNTGGQRNVTFRVKQRKHVNDETDIAVKSFTIVQKSGTSDIKIYSRNTDAEISNYTVDFSSYTALTNEDYKIHSIGGGWEVESKIDTATNLDAGWVSITPASGSFNTDPTVQPNYYIDTDIRISLDPNSDIERNRTCIVTFRNTVNTAKKVSLTLIQQKADIFLTYDTNINELIRKANNKNAGEIYSSSPSVNFAIDEILCNKQGGTVTYYAFLFTGGSNEAGIIFDTYNGMTSSIGTINSSNVDASEIINAEVELDQSYNYNSNGNAILKKCVVTVFANNDTTTKNLGLKIESTVSTNNITLLFVGQQSGSSYSADGNFEFTGQNTEFALGDFDTATGDRVIPVYGKTYTLAIHNKLQHDSLKITQAYFDSDESLNRDHAVNGVVDTSDWASHGSLPTISANGQGEFTITINPYRIKESLENRDEAFSTDINKKVYRLIVHAKALSQSGDDSSIALENYNAVQYSVNLRQTSWKLLGGEPDANGISKIYSFNTQGSNFPTQSQRYAYSADTGLKVYGSDGVIDETILNQQEDTDIIRILADDTRRDKALDERFGVRNENSN